MALEEVTLNMHSSIKTGTMRFFCLCALSLTNHVCQVALQGKADRHALDAVALLCKR